MWRQGRPGSHEPVLLLQTAVCRLVQRGPHVGTQADKDILLKHRHRTLFYGERRGRVL